MGDARWSVGKRIAADVRLAHSEIRTPHSTDFPDPADLVPEQIATYRAAANGYLAIFGHEAVEAIDMPSRCDVPELEITVAASLGIAMRTVDGTITLRKLSVTGRPTSLDEITTFAMALVLGSGSDNAISEIRIVLADLISLDISEQAVDLAEVHSDAVEWFETNLAAARDLAAIGKPATGDECTYCEFIWNCDAHSSARLGTRPQARP